MSFLIAANDVLYHTISYSTMYVFIEYMSQAVAHSLKISYLSIRIKKEGRKKLSIDCLSQRHWLGLFLYEIGTLLRYIFGWLLWMGGRGGGYWMRWWWECAKNLILWMNAIGDKRWECSFPFMEPVNNIHIPHAHTEKWLVAVLIFIYRFLSSKFPNSDKWFRRRCRSYFLLQPTSQCFYNIAAAFFWQLLLEFFCWIVSFHSRWIGIAVYTKKCDKSVNKTQSTAYVANVQLEFQLLLMKLHLIKCITQ